MAAGQPRDAAFDDFIQQLGVIYNVDMNPVPQNDPVVGRGVQNQ